MIKIPARSSSPGEVKNGPGVWEIGKETPEVWKDTERVEVLEGVGGVEVWEDSGRSKGPGR